MVDADIVGVITQFDAAELSEIVSPQDANGTIAGTGHIHSVTRWLETNALWLLKTGQGVTQCTFDEIDDADGVVAELGNEQKLVFQIDSEMVDAAANGPERNLGFQLEQRRSGIGPGVRRGQQAKREKCAG
jgi:hypothetical protein